MNKKIIKILLLTCSITTSAYAIQPGFYTGLQIGQTNLHNETAPVQTGIPATPTNSVKPSNTGIGQRIFAGIGVNKFFAVELGYTHYAASTYKSSPSMIVNTPSVRQYGIDLSGKVMYPIDRFAVFGTLGMTNMKKTVSGSLQPLSTSERKISASSSIHPLVGAGVSYEITPSWIADLSATRALAGSGFKPADFIGVGISYHFVDQYCGQFLCP